MESNSLIKCSSNSSNNLTSVIEPRPLSIHR